MGTVKLDTIPAEILQCICDVILSFTDLKSFALVNKHIRSAAKRGLFRGFFVIVQNRRQLELFNEFWTDQSCLRYVQRLYIQGTLSVGAMDPQTVDETGEGLALQRPTQDPDWFKHPWKADDRTPQETLDEDGEWYPLAEFIRKLPALKDIFYDCTNQLSPCLLAALQEHHPQCRLHMKNFHFRSAQDASNDSHEFAIATSPCLHHIDVSFSKNQRAKEAVFRTISTLAPNLREVTASMSTRGSNVDPRRRRSFVPWPGFSIDAEKSISRQGRLSTLHLSIYDKLYYAEVLKIWQNLTDFSLLRVLTLHGNMKYDVLQWLARERPFKSLRVLDAVCKYFGRDNMQHYLYSVSSFVASLPPLESLDFEAVSHPVFDSHYFKDDGTINKVFVSMIQGHTQSLRRLRLFSYIHDEADVIQIRQSCPLLEDFYLGRRQQRRTSS